MATGTSALDHSQRQLVGGILVVLTCSIAAFASYNFVIDPLVIDLDATRAQKVQLRQIPNVGTLLVVFLVGVWGSRLGARRVIFASAAVMTVGYAIVLIAPVVPVVTVGMLLGSIGRQGIAVVAITLIASRLTQDRHRATGFAAIGLATPAAYLAVPLLATVLLDMTNWRVVVATWVAFAACSVLSARFMLPRDTERSPTGEMWTPALAGVVLVALVQFVKNVSNEGIADPRTLGWITVMTVALLLLWQLMARLSNPTLDISALRHGGFRLILVVVALVPFANLFYYFTIGAQRLYGYSATETALLLVPAQLVAVIGAWLVRGWLQRLGLRTTGTALLLGLSIVLLLTFFQTVDTPVLYPIVVLCLFALTSTGAGIVVTNAIMNLASTGQEGSASAITKSAGAVGAAVGVALSAAVFFGASEATLQGQSLSTSDESLAAEVLDELRDVSKSRSEIAAQYALTEQVVVEYEDHLKESLVSGYRAQGLLGGIVGIAATLVFFFNRQGVRQRDEELAT